MNVIEIKNLRFKQGDFILNIEEFKVKSGKKIALLGENGAGKSTFFNLLAGIYDNYKGEIILKDRFIKKYGKLELAKNISYLPQFSEIIFGFSVFETVLFGRYSKTLGNYTKIDYEQTDKWLKTLGLEDLSNRKFNELSGGEKRRVMLARVLNQESDVVMMDEPFSMIDIKFIKNIKKLLKQLDRTIICSTHDINHVKGVCDTVLFLKKGRLVASLSMEEVNEEVLSEIFEVEFDNINGYFMAV